MATSVSLRTTTVLSVADSVTIARNFLKLGLGAVAWHRQLFPESDFNPIVLKGKPGHNIKDDSRAAQMLLGVFAALDKRYLRQVTVVIYDAVTFEPLESYPFFVSYGQTVQLSFDVDGNTRKGANEQFTAFLDDLTTYLATLKPLERRVGWTMQLHYYEDRTPPNYHPPGFAPAPEDAAVWSATESDVTPRMVGAFQTAHHLISLGARGKPSSTASFRKALEEVGAIPPSALRDVPAALQEPSTEPRRCLPEPTAQSPLNPLSFQLVSRALDDDVEKDKIDADQRVDQPRCPLGPPPRLDCSTAKKRFCVIAAAAFFLWAKYNKASGRFQASDVVTCPVFNSSCIAFSNTTRSHHHGRITMGLPPLPPAPESSEGTEPLVTLSTRDVFGAMWREKLAIKQTSGWYAVNVSPQALQNAARIWRDPVVSRVVTEKQHERILAQLTQDLDSIRQRLADSHQHNASAASLVDDSQSRHTTFGVFDVDRFSALTPGFTQEPLLHSTPGGKRARPLGDPWNKRRRAQPA